MKPVPIVIGLGFGDEGKGATVDFLASQKRINYVVRFSGGPQAAHNVITDDGRHHTFSQFGSGTFQGAGTILTEHMMVNPLNMVSEAEALIAQTGSNPFTNTLIDRGSMMITPLHIAANQQRETNRGVNRHGSCGQGIGETKWLSLTRPDLVVKVGDLDDPSTLHVKLEAIREFYKQEIPGYRFNVDADLLDAYTRLYHDIFQYVTNSQDTILQVLSENKDSIIFEGSQGTLLDEVHGFHPHTTWSDVTANNALRTLRQIGVERDEVNVLGVFRTYLTRHGDGPFPTEFVDEAGDFPEPHNGFGKWQGDFRVGKFDMVLARYAVNAVGGVDHISLTHCDRPMKSVITAYTTGDVIPQEGNAVEGFNRQYRDKVSQQVSSIRPDQMTEEKWSLDKLISNMETEFAPVSICAYGPRTSDRKAFIGIPL